MTTNEDIRNIQINVRESFTKSPENALNTSKSYAEVTNALVCTYSEGSRKTIMDMPTKLEVMMRDQRLVFMHEQLFQVV